MVSSNSNPSSSIPYGRSPSPEAAPSESERDMQRSTDDLTRLLSILPEPIQTHIEQHPQRDVLIEIVMDLGRRPEARFPGQAEYLSDDPITQQDLQDCVDRVGHFGGDNRAGIEQTLHRISAIRNRSGDIIGLTCRVGRAVFGTIGLIRDLVERGQSILMLGRPGVGKNHGPTRNCPSSRRRLTKTGGHHRHLQRNRW